MPCILSAQNIVTKQVSEFNKIEHFGNMEVRLQKGDAYQVKADMKDFADADITIKVSEGELIVRLGSNLLDEDAAIQVTITHGDLKKISAAGGADIYSNEQLSSESLYLVANSGGTMNFDIHTDKLKTRVSSGSTITLKGTAKEHETIASAGGVMDCFSLETETGIIKTNTGGIAKVKVSKTLDANASTKGYIGYKGNPEKIEKKMTLGGDIAKEE